MATNTLYNKIWNLHKVETLPTGQDQLLIGLHLIHEVTTPQAFAAMKERGGRVLFPERTFATVDHIIPTIKQLQRPYQDNQSEIMSKALEQNIEGTTIQFFKPGSGKQGIVHVIGPELGLTQPGMTIACGDSHTSTHGAFGSLGFGIGTTEVGLVLETQTLALNPFKVRRINFNGSLTKGVYAKDVMLKIIQQLGVKGGIGYAYEFGGEVFDHMSMEERMTVCNMSIDYMKFKPGTPLKGQKIDVAFIGSCTNSRLSDLREAATILKDNKIHPDVHTIVVPGSEQVRKSAEEEGLDEIFKAAGAEWRESGCSMCLGMNPDKLIGDQV